MRYRFLCILLLCTLGLRAKVVGDVYVTDSVDRTQENFVIASYLVAAPANVLYSVFGHSIIRLQCPTYGLDYCFSFESEDVRYKILTFLSGNLKMGMFAVPTSEYLASCEQEKRGVREYILNMTPRQKQKLWQVVDENVMRGGNLPYDFIERGCAYSCFNLLTDVIGKDSIEYSIFPQRLENRTWREIAYNSIPKGADWQRFIMMILVGNGVDRVLPPDQSMIISEDVIETLQHATYNGKTIAPIDFHWLVPASEPMSGIWYSPSFFAVVLLLLEIISTICYRKFDSIMALKYAFVVLDYSILCVQGLIGCIVTYLVLFSKLPCTNWNWLIIPYNILPVIFWHWRRYWVIPYAILSAVWILAMVGYPHLLVDPAIICLVMAFIIVLLKQKKIWRK